MLYVICYVCYDTPANAEAKVQVFVQTKIKTDKRMLNGAFFSVLAPPRACARKGQACFSCTRGGQRPLPMAALRTMQHSP